MKNSKLCKPMLPFAAMLAITFSLGITADADEKPNVIVIFTDDHGFADLSAQNVFKDVKTPHIDALATGGVRMTSGYVTAPQCVPSRGGLLTGRYQNRFGLESNGNAEGLVGFGKTHTIAERLKNAGYATGMSGKWHLGPPHEIPGHGFDYVYYKNGGRPGWANVDLQGKDAKPGPAITKAYHLDANTQAAVSFIKRFQKQPFFFYLAYRAPHVPLDATAKYLRRFPGKMPERRRQALAMLSAVDDGVGSIMATLRELKLEDNTLIFFIGDNGAPLKIHKIDAPGGGPGWDGSMNDPLNGEKGMLAEGGIRVPFIAYWKNKIQGGQVYDHPVISLDVAATANALAGLPADPELDGVNLVPHLTGGTTKSPHETLYWRWIAQSAVREGKWKYLRGGTRSYLFNLDSDMEEKHNLAKAHPQIAKRLHDKLVDWSSRLTSPGITTKPMSTTWESYFDYYLDGKPATLPSKTRTPQPKGPSTNTPDWIARNGLLKFAGNTLEISPKSNTKQPPFIVVSNISLKGPVAAKVRMKSATGGSASFAWREQGQKDFINGQSSSFKVVASTDWQEFAVKLKARQLLIHLRLILPNGISVIDQIELVGNDNKPILWNFAGGNR